MKPTITSLCKNLKAKYIGKKGKLTIDAVSIDSRLLQNNNKTLFFAIVGTNYDAHDFILDLCNNGVKYFVVSTFKKEWEGRGNFFLVDNTLQALQSFAAYHRKKYTFPIISITGSNGKTIVKEWLNFLLSPDYNIIRSPKSYNSQVGVPLSVLGINELHNLGIFEAGISTINEMDKLEKIIQPTIGILTNIGSAHDEGFAYISQKIKEKVKLFKNVELLIYNKNKTIDAFLDPKIKTFSWASSGKNADVIIHRKIGETKTTLNVTFRGICFKIQIPFRDEASIENVIHCLMVLLYFDYEVETIQERLTLLFPIEMRLKVKKGINNITLIDDSYSADFQSISIALDFLEHQRTHAKKTIILSDIFQSGLDDEQLYSNVSQLVISNKINRVIAIGETISKFKHKFLNCIAFKNVSQFIENIEKLHFENETLLIKGARAFNFEQIVSLLEEKTHETVLEINLNSLSHNYNFYKSKLKPKVKMMVMVKAFSYGNGGLEIAKLLEYHKVDYLGVAFADEGIGLKTQGITTPIMVLNPETTSFGAIIQHQLEPEIYSIKGLNAFLKIAKQKNLFQYPIHIKLDTGMHRLGFEKQHLEELILLLKDNKTVTVKSILSHLATSDDKNRSFALQQIELFKTLSLELTGALNISPMLHILNSSGISQFPEAQFDMVRLGIGLYGISNFAEEQRFLENVGTLKSIISQIRTIQKGESVGYGRKFIAKKEMKIATIPIGYADGIRRSWGNENGFVLINNQKATIIGSICMDMLMVDVTAISCIEGSEVILMGEHLSPSFIATKLNTIPYEILTSISPRVKRIFYRE